MAGCSVYCRIQHDAVAVFSASCSLFGSRMRQLCPALCVVVRDPDAGRATADAPRALGAPPHDKHRRSKAHVQGRAERGNQRERRPDRQHARVPLATGARESARNPPLPAPCRIGVVCGTKPESTLCVWHHYSNGATCCILDNRRCASSGARPRASTLSTANRSLAAASTLWPAVPVFDVVHSQQGTTRC